MTWSVNSVCHFLGSRRFDTDDRSTNVFWLALPSLGESWHHNHHAFPRSAVHGLRTVGGRPLGADHRGAGEARPGPERGAHLTRAPGRANRLSYPPLGRLNQLLRCGIATPTSVRVTVTVTVRHWPRRKLTTRAAIRAHGVKGNKCPAPQRTRRGPGPGQEAPRRARRGAQAPRARARRARRQSGRSRRPGAAAPVARKAPAPKKAAPAQSAAPRRRRRRAAAPAPTRP